MLIFPGLVGTTLEIDQGGGGREATRREDGLVEGKAGLRLFTMNVRRPEQQYHRHSRHPPCRHRHRSCQPGVYLHRHEDGHIGNLLKGWKAGGRPSMRGGPQNDGLVLKRHLRCSVLKNIPGALCKSGAGGPSSRFGPCIWLHPPIRGARSLGAGATSHGG